MSRLASEKVLRSAAYPVAGSLGAVLEGAWATEWDLRGHAPHHFELLGDPCVHLVLEAGRSRVVGVWTRCWRRTLEGAGLIRAVKVRSGCVGAFIAGSAHRLTDKVTPWRDVFGSAATQLERDVLGVRDDAAAFARLSKWLEHRQRPLSADARDVAQIFNEIERNRALTTVEAVALAGSMTPRQLQKLFREYVGASPKWVLRRFRLQEAARLLERGRGPSIAEVAATLGYADQAHFSRDFRSAVGRTPRAFMQHLSAR